MNPSLCVLALTTLLSPSLLAQDSRPATQPQEAVANQLTDKEKEDGWLLLFDGKTTDQWRRYQREEFPQEGWGVEEGAIVTLGSGGDVITKKQFENFDFRFEWKVVEGANSGVMYRVAEIENASYWTGPEYQILDDGNHRDGRNNSTSAGALYALYSPNDDKVVKPVGEWNTARIVIQGEHVEHWLNGKKIVEATFGSDDWKEKVADSKFAPWEHFGTERRGHLALQAHGAPVHFRNLKIRELPPTGERDG
jgi:hypothetical protein